MLDVTPATLFARAIVLLIAMAVHEFAHGYVAYLMGDSTAKDAGRMTLDPRANINPGGFLFGVLIGIGILGSAPVNPARMRSERWGHLLAVLAGPVSNLLLAVIFAMPFWFGLPVTLGHPTVGSIQWWFPTVQDLLFQSVLLNVILFIFNLVPVFPLDGWSVVMRLMPVETAIWWQRNRQNSTYVGIGLMALSFIGPDLFAMLPGFLQNTVTYTLLNPLTVLVFEPVQVIFRFLVGF